MHAQIFPAKLQAFDIADSLVEVVFNDDKGSEVAVRMTNQMATDLRDQLTKKLEGKFVAKICPTCNRRVSIDASIPPQPPGSPRCPTCLRR